MAASVMPLLCSCSERTVTDELYAFDTYGTITVYGTGRELSGLKEVADKAWDAIYSRIESLDEKKIKEKLKKVVFKSFKNNAADLFALIICDWMVGYDYENSDVVELLELFPALSKAFNVTTKDLKAYRDAEKAVSKFKKDNNI